MVFDKEYDNDNRNDRITIQKIIFLAEQRGLNLGNFSFMEDGKQFLYSLDLRMAILDELKDKTSPTEYNFSNFAINIAEALKNLYDLANEHQLKLLYLMANIYFAKAKAWKKSDDAKDVITFLDEKKLLEDYSSLEISIAYDKASQWGYNF